MAVFISAVGGNALFGGNDFPEAVEPNARQDNIICGDL